jgi:hypothetical protein
MSEAWQTVIVAAVALVAASWLVRRSIRKRKAKVACDQCAAAAIVRAAGADRRPAG